MKSESKAQRFKICFMGMTGSGKTSVINRLVNNYFTDIYNPTLQTNEYYLEFEPFEMNTSQNLTPHIFQYASNNVGLVLEDMFGLDNTIIQTPENFIKASSILNLRRQMIKDFQDMIMTNKHLEKKKFDLKNRKSIYKNKSESLRESYKATPEEEAERVAFVFVIDLNSKLKVVKEIQKILENLKSVEKSSSCKPAEKMIIFNKTDLLLTKSDRKRVDEFQELEKTFTNEYDCDVFKVSTKTLDNFKEAFNYFFNKICMNRLEKMKEVAKTDYFIEDEERGGCFNTNCTRGFTCG